MALEDYKVQFATTTFSLNVDGMHRAHFLKLNDNSAASNPGKERICGRFCTRHRLVLSSEVTQRVYYTAHTWDRRL